MFLFGVHFENMLTRQAGHAQIQVQAATYLYIEISKHL